MGTKGRELVCPQIRRAQSKDIPEVLKIEKDCFEPTWTEEDFLECLRSHRSNNRICLVVEVGEKLVGFMIYELNGEDINLMNLAVSPVYQRRGIGTSMVAQLIRKLSYPRCPKITLEVHETNLIAQLFFKSQGFRATKVLRGYYEDTGEDVFVMEYVLGRASRVPIC